MSKKRKIMSISPPIFTPTPTPSLEKDYDQIPFVLNGDIPTVIFLAITTHGQIKVKNYKPDTFTLPENITYTTLNAVQTGVCNFTNAETARNFSKLIIKNSFGLNLEKDSDFHKVTNKIQRELKLEFKSNKQQPIEHTDLVELYKRNINNMFQMKTFENTEIINKTFVSNKQYDWEANDNQTYDNSIFIANMIGLPNLLHLMSRRRHHSTIKITTKEIINFLIKKGVKKIFAVDFSCSFLTDELNHAIEKRTARSIKRTYAGKRKTKKSK